MSQTEPQTLGELWRMIERDSQSTRAGLELIRDQVKRELDEVRKRLDTFVTRDHFEAEKRLLEARITHAEEALEKLEREARETVGASRQSRREFVYKGLIPILSLLIAAVSIYVASSGS